MLSPDGPSGPEYDLVRAFADDLGVDLVLHPLCDLQHHVLLACAVTPDGTGIFTAMPGIDVE